MISREGGSMGASGWDYVTKFDGDVEGALATLRSLLGECRMRWTGYYVVLYSDDRPSHLGIFGFSGD